MKTNKHAALLLGTPEYLRLSFDLTLIRQLPRHLITLHLQLAPQELNHGIMLTKPTFLQIQSY